MYRLCGGGGGRDCGGGGGRGFEIEEARTWSHPEELGLWSRGGREVVGLLGLCLVWLVLLLENKQVAIFISDFGAFLPEITIAFIRHRWVSSQLRSICGICRLYLFSEKTSS